VFYGWTGALAILALFGTIDYSIFVTVPTVMVYQQAVRFRSKQLASYGGRIHACLRALEASETWPAPINAKREEYFAELERLMACRELYEKMPVLPFSLRQLTFGAVFYVAQVAQIVALFVAFR
jgi:hypothetical protein